MQRQKDQIINPRTGKLYQEGYCYESTKASRVIFLKSFYNWCPERWPRQNLVATGDWYWVLTTGFNRTSERLYSLRAPDALDNPIVLVELDSSNGVMLSFLRHRYQHGLLVWKGNLTFNSFKFVCWRIFVRNTAGLVFLLLLLIFCDTVCSLVPRKIMEGGGRPRSTLALRSSNIFSSRSDTFRRFVLPQRFVQRSELHLPFRLFLQWCHWWCLQVTFVIFFRLSNGESCTINCIILIACLFSSEIIIRLCTDGSANWGRLEAVLGRDEPRHLLLLESSERFCLERHLPFQNAWSGELHCHVGQECSGERIVPTCCVCDATRPCLGNVGMFLHYHSRFMAAENNGRFQADVNEEQENR